MMTSRIATMLGMAVGTLAVIAALAVAALIGYNAYADRLADQAARKFCRTIRVGSDIDAVIAAASQRGDGNRLEVYEGEHHFRFQAGMLHTCDCALKTMDGKVVAVRVYRNDG